MTVSVVVVVVVRLRRSSLWGESGCVDIGVVVVVALAVAFLVLWFAALAGLSKKPDKPCFLGLLLAVPLLVLFLL